MRWAWPRALTAKGLVQSAQRFSRDEPTVEPRAKGLPPSVFTLATCVTSHPQPLPTRQRGAIVRSGSCLNTSREFPLLQPIETHSRASHPLFTRPVRRTPVAPRESRSGSGRFTAWPRVSRCAPPILAGGRPEGLGGLHTLWGFPTPHRPEGRAWRKAIRAAMRGVRDGLETAPRTAGKRSSCAADITSGTARLSSYRFREQQTFMDRTIDGVPR